MPATLDLTDSGFLTGDRHDEYRALRDGGAVLVVGEPDAPTRLITRYDDVQAVLRDTSGRMQEAGQDAPPWMEHGPALRRLRANMVQTDRPVHTRLRGVVAPLFTGRRVETLREAAATEVTAELDALTSSGGSFDAVTQLAARVPRGVLRLLIGMPDDDWEPILAAQTDFLMIFSPFPLDDARRDRLDEVAQFYFDYFDGLLGRAAEPTELVRRLLDAEQAGELSRDEVLSLLHTVLDAGFETTRTSISNAVELFATVPGLHDRVRADPSLVEGTAEETLRLRAPVQLIPRILTEDRVVSDGTTVPAGAHTLCVLGSANLDERTFDDPGSADPRRANASKHLSFGGGLHHCLGAPLARIQLQETVAGLARRFCRIEPDGPSERYPSLMFPALSTLPVRAQA
ncbi:cytochrome P450 [Pseudonocardia endophytica]|uniref:Cytochrome P450 n=1 Tax=Pseudonocardia endophytica TaxID=401976 RepID=A0A4R1HHB6_PSEEN|nr:cytochrome P450 [Pseudonocardia endophytica]TCK21128.1 cytochrome P450 [Pseudonocardia endophytica]